MDNEEDMLVEDEQTRADLLDLPMVSEDEKTKRIKLYALALQGNKAALRTLRDKYGMVSWTTNGRKITTEGV